jgi:hypothetical protein
MSAPNIQAETSMKGSERLSFILPILAVPREDIKTYTEAMSARSKSPSQKLPRSVYIVLAASFVANIVVTYLMIHYFLVS